MADLRLTCIFALLFATLSLATAAAQHPSAVAPSAPVPTPILTARKVFIANGGYDANSRAAFEREHQSNRPYNELYAAMKKWGHYELVSAPAESDLVFTIRFTAPISNLDKLTSYQPQMEVTIFDAKTHFVLWTITAPVEGAYRKTTWDRNFAQGMSTLMTELKALTENVAVTEGKR